MRFEHSLEIDAPPDRVWAILADLPGWPKWTPTVKSFEWVEGNTLAVGAKARVQLDGSPTGVWTVTSVDEGRSFNWQSSLRGVHTDGGHIVDPAGDGTRLTLTLEYSGFMATLFRPMIARVSKRNLPLEAGGLKRAAEAAVTVPA